MILVFDIEEIETTIYDGKTHFFDIKCKALEHNTVEVYVSMLLIWIWERVVRVQLFAKQKLQKSLEQNASLLMEAVAKEMNV